MPQHPPAPEELVDLVEGYRQAMRSLIDLGRSCPPEMVESPTPCPGWNVKDHFSHVASLETYFDGGDYPVVELPRREHVRSAMAEWMEYGVQARREQVLTVILDDLETLLFNRCATLRNPELTRDSMVRGPMGRSMTLADLLARRLVDIWVHEQDVREALGRIGNLDTPAAAMFVSRIVEAFPAIVQRRLDLAEGTTVIVESTGPVTARMGIRMAQDATGTLVAHPLFSGSVDGGDATAGSSSSAVAATSDSEAGAVVSITMTMDALTRRCAGRRPTDDTPYKVIGDEETARAVLDAVVITP